MPPDLGQLLGSLFGVGGGAAVGPGGAPTITVTTSGVPSFIQGVSEFMQQVGVLNIFVVPDLVQTIINLTVQQN